MWPPVYRQLQPGNVGAAKQKEKLIQAGQGKRDHPVRLSGWDEQ